MRSAKGARAGWTITRGSPVPIPAGASGKCKYDDSEHAGGDTKNRLVDTTIRLDKGSYVVHFVSDDSHSANEWNASSPADGTHWG